jgi:hypothetical protein
MTVERSPLWSERRGGSLSLTKEGFATLLTDVFLSLRKGGYLDQTLGWPGVRANPFGDPPDDARAKRFFAMRLGDPWPVRAMGSATLLELTDDEQIFDLIELLHRDVVSKPLEGNRREFDRAAGLAVLRERINPVLARRDPPLELSPEGHIIERVQEPFRRLVEQPLPETAPKKEVQERVDDAVTHFRRRNATSGDRRAAVRELADVLEFL